MTFSREPSDCSTEGISVTEKVAVTLESLETWPGRVSPGRARSRCRHKSRGGGERRPRVVTELTGSRPLEIAPGFIAFAFSKTLFPESGSTHVHHRLLLLVASLLFVPGVARAGDLTFTQDFDARFQFNVFDPHTGAPTGWVDYEAAGALTFTIDSAINDPNQTTVQILDVKGTLSSVYPSPILGPYTISPDVAFLGGELTNIVRDGSGNLTSADVSDLAMQWSLSAAGGAVYVFTADAGGLPFDGPITSLPFSYGTVLSGADQFNVYANEGGSNVVVAYGRDRTLTAVPEPSSLALLGIGAVGLYCFGRRYRYESIL